MAPLGPSRVGGQRATAIEMNHSDLIREACPLAVSLSVRTGVTRTGYRNTRSIEILESFLGGGGRNTSCRRGCCWSIQLCSGRTVRVVMGGRFVLRCWRADEEPVTKRPWHGLSGLEDVLNPSSWARQNLGPSFLLSSSSRSAGLRPRFAPCVHAESQLVDT